MSTSETTLGFARIVFGWPVIIGGLGLYILLRYRGEISELLKNVRVKSPAGWVLESSQKLRDADSGDPTPLVKSFAAVLEEKDREIQSITGHAREIIDRTRVESAIWEFRYLDVFLVPKTKGILWNWFYMIPGGISLPIYHQLWAARSEPEGSVERDTILQVLLSAQLVERSGDNYSITDKGNYFLQFIGFIPRTQ